MRALCIDPGSTRSGVVEVEIGPLVLDPPWGIVPLSAEEVDNDVIVRRWHNGTYAPGDYPVLVIETMPTVFGGMAARDQLRAERWAGRFIEAHASRAWAGEADCIVEVARASAKAAVAGSARANDAAVRRALIDLYGGDAAAFGERCKCGGKRKSPCPYGCADNSGWITPPGVFSGWTGSHGFAALALAHAAFRPGGTAEHLRPRGGA